MDAPAPAVRRACSCAWPMECSEMVDSCALGHKFVSFGCRDGSALRKVEFFEWMSLCGHNVGPRDKPTRTVEKMWQQCVGGTGILFRLSHFDHEDIVCGCGLAAAGSCGEQGVLLGTCKNPKLTRSMETRHRDSLRAVRDGQPKPPPRPTMRPGRPGGRSKARQGPFMKKVRKAARGPPMPPAEGMLPPPPARPQPAIDRPCASCARPSARLQHSCDKRRGTSRRWSSPTSGVPDGAAAAAVGGPAAASAAPSSAGWGPFGSGRLSSGPGRALPAAITPSARTPSPAVSKLADGVRPRVAEPTPCKVPEEDGWLSKRHWPQELDVSLHAKKARQMQARHQPNGLALDPAKLPQHLYASTFPAAWWR